MKQFLSVEDVPDPELLVQRTLEIKKSPFSNQMLGKNKVLGLIFFNPSLRTRLSTAKAAYNLGMRVMVLNVSNDSWQLEMEDGAIMDQGKAEHVREAAAVIGSYCDIIGLRSFPTLKDRKLDYQEKTLMNFVKHSGVPVINMESATLHPLQSLTDLMTIREFSGKKRPKVILSWAPHVSALPQAVPNSFSEWMNQADVDFSITCPEGMELDQKYIGNARVIHNQEEALTDADFVYVKNWSSYEKYGKIHQDKNWMITLKKLEKTNKAKLMHCLPVRRNVVISDDALDSMHSVVITQAGNREFAAQAVIESILQNEQ